MNCLLKRFLPFALTLIVGLMLWSLLSKSTHSVDIIAPKYTGVGFGSGTGCGPHPDNGVVKWETNRISGRLICH